MANITAAREDSLRESLLAAVEAKEHACDEVHACLSSCVI